MTQRKSSSNGGFQTQRSAIAAVLSSCSSILFALAIVSGIINILMLTGSIFMMQVYDRVMSSHSVPTLVALALIAVGAYIFMGILDILRNRVLTLIGERIDTDVGPKIHEAVVQLPLQLSQNPQETVQPLRDLEHIRTFVSGPGLVSLFDLPWVPIYLIVIYLLHPALFSLAGSGAALLIVLTIFTEFRSKKPSYTALSAQSARNHFSDTAGRGGEVIKAMGMMPAFTNRWEEIQSSHLKAQRKLHFIIYGMSATSRMFRMILQSAVLGADAYLAVKGEISSGSIIAASILSSRALAPIDQAIAHWRSFVAARQSNARLKLLLSLMPGEVVSFELPPPTRSIIAQNVSVCAPATVTTIIRRISFNLDAGDALAIIGPSACGKSTLARALVGVWPAKMGKVMLDGAQVEQWKSEILGPAVGFLPQDIQLFEGTIANNIGRFSADASSDDVIKAAKAANFHDHIISFPEGYDTQVGPRGERLSGGQRQRLGLARALFGEPFLVVLDEPNAHLDADGEASVNQAICGVRERGGIVIVIAHRPSIIAAVNKLLAMKDGEMLAFGPKEEVLARTVQNAEKILKQPPQRSDGLKVVHGSRPPAGYKG